MSLSIYHRSQCETSEQAGYWLLQKYPEASFFDAANYIFCETFKAEISNAPVTEVQPILLSDFVDAEGEPLTGDKLVWALAKALSVPVDQRTRPIHGSAAQMNQLHMHPAWRLWVGQYDDQQSFDSDIAYVSGMIETAGMTDALMQWQESTAGITYDQAAGIMLTMIRANS